MRNIRIFDEYSDYLATQEIVSGTGKYVEDIFPGFVYVRELAEKGIYAFYNGEENEEYEFGDVIYYDGTPKLKKVYYSAFTPSMGEKVGLVVVPTALSPDGNARIMAFGSITREMQITPGPVSPILTSKPESKDVVLGESMSYTKAFTQWHDNMADENQTVYTCVPGFYLDGGSSPKGSEDNVAKASVPGSEGKTSYYESPISLSNTSEMSHFSSDANFMYPNPHTNGEYYNTANTLVAISPFLGDSLKEQDPAYLQEELAGGSISPTPSPIKAASPVLGATKDSLGGGNYNAFSDFSGYTWTYGCPPEYSGGSESIAEMASPSLKSSKPVGGVLGAYFPHDYVRQFYTDGTQQGDWYLPSMGEMGFVAARYKKILEIFDYLYSVGAVVEDGTDNMPGSIAPIWTSTIGANGGGSYVNLEDETTFNASIPGDNTFPAVSPVVVIISADTESSGGGSIITALSSNSGLLGAAVDTQNLECDVQFVLNYSESEESAKALLGATTVGKYGNEVLPFAMIKKGEIQRTMGDYTVANGHQMKDFSQSGGGEK